MTTPAQWVLCRIAAVAIWTMMVCAEIPVIAADSEKIADEKFFNDSVLPILQQHCFKCHSHATKVPKGGLVLDSRSGWVTGGDTGPAIVPGKPDESLLIQAVRYGDLKMPPSGKLPPELVAILEKWVATGAIDPRTTDTVKSP